MLAERGVHELDGHLSVERRVVGAVDLPHPALAERRDQLIVTQSSAGWEPHTGKDYRLANRVF